MIPRVMIDFLARSSVAIASTRDANLQPQVHWLTGWAVDDDGCGVTCLVSQEFTQGLRQALDTNGCLTIVAEVIGPHECYQFKGHYDGLRDVTDADRRTHHDCRERFVTAVNRFTGGRYDADVLVRQFGDPALAVRLRVEEIFTQTPGPGAGGRIFPPAED